MQKLDGTAPTKLLEDRSTFVSLGSEPKDAGIVPWRRGDSIIVSAMLER